MLQPLTLNGNLLVGLDVETTGLAEGYHDLVQIAIQPVGTDLRPHASFPPFLSYLRPLHPERAVPQALETNGLSLDWLMDTAPEPGTVAARLDDYIYSLGLAVGKTVIPLCHNWAFESGFLKAWLGIDHMQTALGRRAADTMITARYFMDRAEVAGQEPPFPGLSLSDLTKHFNIVNDKAHDALADAIATVHLYRHLLEWDLSQRTVINYVLPPVQSPPLCPTAPTPIPIEPYMPPTPWTPYQPTQTPWPTYPYWPAYPTITCLASNVTN
jgi:DNA polymerase III epsilon subunit-like protein